MGGSASLLKPQESVKIWQFKRSKMLQEPGVLATCFGFFFFSENQQNLASFFPSGKLPFILVSFLVRQGSDNTTEIRLSHETLKVNLST